jgi:Pyruvate/2-oxoacid:ferredoxin oxidoreductase delta subunit
MTSDWTREELEKQAKSMRAVTVPVNMLFRGQQHILDLSEMEKILREAKTISLGECGCRKKYKKCDAPLDVCLSLDKEAEEFVKKGLGRKVGLAEALDALRRSHEADLVHITYTFEGQQKPNIVCSCCSCCCGTMSALIRFGMPNVLATSRYVASTDAETCISCGKCVERCQFGARRLDGEKMVYDRARCFGCGLCVTTCPTKSIALMRRS